MTEQENDHFYTRLQQAHQQIDFLRSALREIATAEHCHEHSWSKVGPDNPYRNTCCIETEKDRRKWCVTCVAADALGWDTDHLVRECAGARFSPEESNG